MKLSEVRKMENCGCFPTPLQRMDRLSEELGCNILFKRDDLTGLGFSGNKIRKLQYLVRDARDQGCTTLLTFGGVQTNHGRQTAAVACKYGMKSVIIASLDGAQPPQRLSGNLLLDEILGCDVRFLDVSALKNCGLSPDEIKAETVKLRRKAADQVIAEYEAHGEKVYEMPAGGSTPIGCLGYFYAVQEMQEQLKQMGQTAEYLVCPSGSCGTYAGLWLGSRYFHAPFQVIGSCVSPHGQVYVEKMASFINETSRFFDLDITASPEELELLCTQCAGTAYDAPDEKTFAVIQRLTRSEGVFVDPCYTGKGFAGMLYLIETGRIPAGSTVVFLHTGGLPGLYSEQHLAAFNESLWVGQAHPVMQPEV